MMQKPGILPPFRKKCTIINISSAYWAIAKSIPKSREKGALRIPSPRPY
jgi:hypothetical protein